MDKRAVILFSRKYRLLLAFLSAVIVQLPQYIDSIWSLSERISGREGSMNVLWLYWITVPLGLGILGAVYWLAKRPVLSEAEKYKVTELMASVNALDDRMNRYFNESLNYDKDRVAKYQSLLNSSDFNQLWDKCSKQRADINIISPELGEQVRLLLTLLQTSYSYILKDWFVSELPRFREAIGEHVKTTETIRRRIKTIIQKLMG